MASLCLRFLLLDLHLCTSPNSPLVKGEYSGLPEGGGLVPAATTTRNPHLPKTNILKQISKPIRLPDPHSVPCLLSAWEIKLTGNKNVLKGHLNSARPMPMTDFYRSLYMKQIQNIAFSAFQHCRPYNCIAFFDELPWPGLFCLHSPRGCARASLTPGYSNIIPPGFLFPLPFSSSALLIFFVLASARRGPSFCSRPKGSKSLVKAILQPASRFFIPGTPP